MCRETKTIDRMAVFTQGQSWRGAEAGAEQAEPHVAVQVVLYSSSRCEAKSRREWAVLGWEPWTRS